MAYRHHLWTRDFHACFDNHLAVIHSQSISAEHDSHLTVISNLLVLTCSSINHQEEANIATIINHSQIHPLAIGTVAPKYHSFDCLMAISNLPHPH